MIDYSRLPGHMQTAARLYFEEGIPPGSFLEAVLSNELVEAFSKADATNTVAMRDWASFLYNEAPRGSWGSRQIVTDWCKRVPTMPEKLND